jgi:hypothetical protein
MQASLTHKGLDEGSSVAVNPRAGDLSAPGKRIGF